MDNLCDSPLMKMQVTQQIADSEHLAQWHNDGDMREKVEEPSCRIWELLCMCVVLMYNAGYSNSFIWNLN